MRKRKKRPISKIGKTCTWKDLPLGGGRTTDRWEGVGFLGEKRRASVKSSGEGRRKGFTEGTLKTGGKRGNAISKPVKTDEQARRRGPKRPNLLKEARGGRFISRTGKKDNYPVHGAPLVIKEGGGGSCSSLF